MNTEVVLEMMDHRAMLEDTVRMMNETGSMTLHTPNGPVSIAEVKSDAHFIDMLLIDELDEMPISAVLLNLFN